MGDVVGREMEPEGFGGQGAKSQQGGWDGL